MKSIKLIIPDMQSAHCLTRVQGAIKDISGLQVEKLEAGKLAASVESDEVKTRVVEAIERAGYTVSADGEGNPEE